MQPHVSTLVCALLILPITLAATTTATHATKCDVAVVGGGSAGSNAAVFLKDKGYQVCLFEKSWRLGGHCETFRLDAADLPINCSTCQRHTELGVVIYGNTSYYNAVGQGKWNLRTDEHLQRFSSEVVSTDFASLVFNATSVADLSWPLGLAFAPPALTPKQQLAFDGAFQALESILDRYPWLEEAAIPPDSSIPPELLVPLPDFIRKHKLEPLVSHVLRPQLYDGGLGSFGQLTTLYALLNLRKGILDFMRPSKAGIMPAQGCGSLYSGIAAYLGPASVYYHSQVLAVSRLEDGSSHPVHLTVQVDGSIHTFIASKLLVAIPPTMQNMRFLDADAAEAAAFSLVRMRQYAAAAVRFAGPIEQKGAFLLANAGFTQRHYIPKPPAVSQCHRFLPYGPATCLLVMDKPLSVSRMHAVLAAQLGAISSSVATSATVEQLVMHQQYMPFFSADALAADPSPYARFASLQSHKHTWYVGSTYTFAESVKIWEHAFNLVQRYFPSKHAEAL